MIRAEVLDAMLASGCTAEQIACAVKASIAADEAVAVAKKAAAAAKKRRQRSAMSTNVTHCPGDNRDTPPTPETRVSPEPPSQTHPPRSAPKGASLPPTTHAAFSPERPEIVIRKAIVSVCDEMGHEPPAMHLVSAWLDKGYDPEMIRDTCVSGIRRGKRALAYFSDRLAEQHAQMLAERARPPPSNMPSQSATVTPLRPRNEPTSVIDIGRAVASRPPPGYG